MAKRQSLAKSTSKHIARTTGARLISDKLGTGLLGALAKTLFSQASKATDKYELNHDSDFGVTSIDKKSK